MVKMFRLRAPGAPLDCAVTLMYGCSVNADGTKLLIPTVQRNQSDIDIATLN
jgi:hypothetical protein